MLLWLGTRSGGGALYPSSPCLPEMMVFGQQPLHAFPDPADVLGHLGVDAILPSTSAPLPPAHHACHEEGVPVWGNMGSPTVPVARVALAVAVAGAEHVVGDAVQTGLQADGTAYEGHVEPLEHRRLLLLLPHAAKPTDHTLRLTHQHLEEEKEEEREEE